MLFQMKEEMHNNLCEKVKENQELTKEKIDKELEKGNIKEAFDLMFKMVTNDIELLLDLR